MSAMELKNFENQIDLLSFSEQLSLMEYLARLLQRNHKMQETISSTNPKKRQFGSAKGKFLYPENFDEDNEEIAQLFGAI